VLFPWLWAGAPDDAGVMRTGHVLRPLFMPGAMLARFDETPGTAETRSRRAALFGTDRRV